MKKTLTTLCLVCIAAFYSFAQEKGDSFLELNFNTQKNEGLINNSDYELNYISVGLGYSYFIKENRRLKLAASFTSNSSSSSDDVNGYGVNLGYGILFPLLKNFYAELTPAMSYNYQKNETLNNSEYKTNYYTANLHGGVVWVPFKHFGLSANLASIRLGYNKQRNSDSSSNQKSTSTSFSLNSQGSLGSQGFSIFYKF